MDELTQTRIETIIKISDEINEIISNNAEIHGTNDPHMVHIVSAALTLTINQVNLLAPGFKVLMYKMLKGEEDV